MTTYITTLKDGNGNNLAPRTKVDAIDDFNTYHDNTKQNVTDNTLTTANKTVPTAINEVNSIAKGANQAVGYSNYQTMITALNAMDDEEFSMGQNIYIVTVNVPDLWVSRVENISSTYIYTNDATVISNLETYGFIQAGYYKLSMLETQKVDLTNYQTKIDSSHKLSSDLVDDTSSTNKFVTASDITNWNGKGTYSKPSGGIPKTDLASAVQTSLGKADTALQSHQDISGKEDKTNKVTSLSSSSTDKQYPSAKCMYDIVGDVVTLIDNL